MWASSALHVRDDCSRWTTLSFRRRNVMVRKIFFLRQSNPGSIRCSPVVPGHSYDLMGHAGDISSKARYWAVESWLSFGSKGDDSLCSYLNTLLIFTNAGWCPHAHRRRTPSIRSKRTIAFSEYLGTAARYWLLLSFIKFKKCTRSCSDDVPSPDRSSQLCALTLRNDTGCLNFERLLSLIGCQKCN